jgi:transcriptional regulator with XRE-family HTH domain
MPDATPANDHDSRNGQREDPALEIGTRLAAIRVRQGVKVSALAREIGVSASLISQIERGQSRPSVSTLFALAEALAVPVDAFFRDTAEPAAKRAASAEPVPAGQPGAAAADPVGDGEHRYLVHREERAVIDIDGGVRWERLTPTTLRAVDFLELVYAPHAESNASLYRHPGTEMVLVLSGELHIFVGFERYELGPGDSMCFPSTLPHRYLNPTDEEARAVTVILLDGTTPGPAPTGAPMRP